MGFDTFDAIVFVLYCGLVLGVGFGTSRLKNNRQRTTQDYFLASKSLPWWAVGASLIASNISAQQFIGMTGSGYAIGLAIASYEWMAAATLIVVGKFLLPIFIRKGIYTMPQFLEMRFDHRVKTGVAVFFLLDFTFIAATSILYLGALAFQAIANVPLGFALAFVALFAALVTLYGGQKAIAWTDVIQVVFMMVGGLLTTFLALRAVDGGNNAVRGLETLLKKAPEKFDMILSPGHPFYQALPGISVLVGGIWIANLTYWGFNQYIIQRALAAKSIGEAQRGLMFAGYLKLLMPLIVVVPGIAAYVLSADIAKPDEAYPWLLRELLFPGIKGLIFAALIAGIVSSLSAVANS
ncbi:MAG TPA: sodium/solute symporter, partial [Cytophagales bacterium]